MMVLPVGAQTATGPTRTAEFTVRPQGDGYEVIINLVYRFQFCGGDVTLDGYRSNHRPAAYWFQGKRYSENEAGRFKRNREDLFLDLGFKADIFSTAHNDTRIATGRWVLVNLYSGFGGCYGDHGPGGAGLKDRNLVQAIYLRNIVVEGRPSRDLELENSLRQKTSASQQTQQGQGNANSSSSLWGTGSSSGSQGNSSSSLRASGSQQSQVVAVASGSGSGHASEYQARPSTGSTSNTSSNTSAGAGSSTSSTSTSSSSRAAQAEYDARTAQLEAARRQQQNTSRQSSSTGSGISAEQRANNERALATQRQALDNYNEYSRQSFQASTQRVEGMLAAVDADNREREARWAEEERREEAKRREEAEAAEIRRLEREAEAARRRVEEAAAAERRRKEAEHATYVRTVRQGMLNDYVDSKVPISSDNIPVNEIWYFAYEASSVSATVTEVFPINRNNDGTWIYKPNLLREINQAGLIGNVILVGWFSTKEKAQEALNDFKQRARNGEMTLKTVTYAGKVQNQSGGLWGTGTSGNSSGQSSGTRQGGSSLWDR